MPIIILRFDDFKSNTYIPPENCPYCGFEMLQHWGSGEKTVQDAYPEIGKYYRFRCKGCRRTFRHYVLGVDKTHFTKRIRKVAGIACALGLSAREAMAILTECGIELSFMTIWRDGNDIVARFKDSFGPTQLGRYSIYKLLTKNQLRHASTSIVADLGSSKSIILGCIDVMDYSKVLVWLEPILKDLDIQVSVIGTDVLLGVEVS
jgi:hypothetical protein